MNEFYLDEMIDEIINMQNNVKDQKGSLKILFSAKMVDWLRIVDDNFLYIFLFNLFYYSKYFYIQMINEN